MDNIGLRRMFGAQFPKDSEVDHAMALRGYLIFLLRQTGLTVPSNQRISQALRMVTEYLESDLEIVISERRSAAPELFAHYRNTISLHWQWLNELRNLR